MLKEEYIFDIAISLLKQDLPFAQSLFEYFNEYNLKTFLYPHNQSDILNKNGIDVFSKTFKKDARVVVILYREGYGDTYYTRIENVAIQERFLVEGADFCILIPMDGNKPIWYPSFQIYTSNKMSPKDISGLILHKLVNKGGELKPKSFEEHVKVNKDLWQKKTDHYKSLLQKDTYLLLEAGMAEIKTVFIEKNDFLISQNLPYTINNSGLKNDSLKNSIELQNIVLSAFFTPENKNIPKEHCQVYTLNFKISKKHSDISSNNGYREQTLYTEIYKLNTHPDGKYGWSKIIEIIEGADDYKPYILDRFDKRGHYDLDLIKTTHELTEEWFLKYIKIIFKEFKF